MSKRITHEPVPGFSLDLRCSRDGRPLFQTGCLVSEPRQAGLDAPELDVPGDLDGPLRPDRACRDPDFGAAGERPRTRVLIFTQN